MRYIRKDINQDIVVETMLLLKKTKDYNSDVKVRDNLRRIYDGCCAYCECTPEAGAFYHIEHFYPKNHKIYKIYRKSIENLHYSCPICNTLKGQKIPTGIFSPNYYLDKAGNWAITADTKIENELYYIGHLLFAKNINPSSINRGQDTIDFFNLNDENHKSKRRKYLVESRIRCIADVSDIIKILIDKLSNYSSKDNSTIEVLLLKLVEFTESSSNFSTMVIHNYGNEIIKLLKIYLKKKSSEPSRSAKMSYESQE